nr:zinc finger, CCHC-type [Tanacetum cinerariifolium]
MTIPAALPKIALEAAKAAVVSLPTATPDLAIESDPKVEPSEALPSPDYVLSSPIIALASPDYHLRPDTKSEPMEDETSSPPLPDTTVEAVIPEFVIPEATTLVTLVKRCRMIEARCWTFSRDNIDTWRHHEVARIESDEPDIDTLHARPCGQRHMLPSYEDYLGLLELGLWTLSTKLMMQSIDWRSVSMDGFMTERASIGLRSILALDSRLVSLQLSLLTAKPRNDILMFQQHQGEYLSDAWTRFKDLLQKVPHHDSYRHRIINWIDGARQLSTSFAFITKGGIIQIMISMKEKCATLEEEPKKIKQEVCCSSEGCQ